MRSIFSQNLQTNEEQCELQQKQNNQEHTLNLKVNFC